ncbi:hypothetical protein GWI33_014492 [Rhynchophorus ferrugineus]|uniref:Uncharacterized protein n=1 Tax=Rhynchophorus ferrugineus TaxID=354439 RepID=A0A834I2H6_RHYFE|nr:hypothetical protein GWI33_014492 [Rhynchophorus ferrugineus]
MEPLDLSMPKEENLPLKKRKNLLKYLVALVELVKGDITNIKTPNIISMKNDNPKRLYRSRFAEERIRLQAGRNLHAEFCLAPPEDVHEKHITK